MVSSPGPSTSTPSAAGWGLAALFAAAAATEAALTPAIAQGSWVPAASAAAMAVPLAWRAVHPLPALMGTLAVFAAAETSTYSTLSEAVTPFLVLVVAMYSAATRLRPRLLFAALAASFLAIGGTIVQDGGWDLDSLLYAALVVAAAFMTGRLVGARTREAARLTDENVVLVREREERERAAAARERMRIAQELHDIITHRVSAMVLEASTERRIVERGGAATADLGGVEAALASIETLGREAMQELRQLLGALHHGGDQPRAPQPGAADLDLLVERTAKAHAAVHLEREGPLRELPKALDVSVYRLVQEALSNAMRHAPGSSVGVLIRYLPDAVQVVVTNSRGHQRDDADPGLGLGLAGMRERATVFGGSFEAGPTPDGGFRVSACLPATDDATERIAP